jgi:hypothetical protein
VHAPRQQLPAANFFFNTAVIYVCMYVHTYVRTYVCVCVYVDTHKHTHAHLALRAAASEPRMTGTMGDCALMLVSSSNCATWPIYMYGWLSLDTRQLLKLFCKKIQKIKKNTIRMSTFQNTAPTATVGQKYKKIQKYYK